jgi:hypothetical protein
VLLHLHFVDTEHTAKIDLTFPARDNPLSTVPDSAGRPEEQYNTGSPFRRKRGNYFAATITGAKCREPIDGRMLSVLCHCAATGQPEKQHRGELFGRYVGRVLELACRQCMVHQPFLFRVSKR